MENKNSKKNGKKAIIFIIGILVVGLVYGGMIFKKPENKILMGAATLAKSDDIQYTSRIYTNFQTGISEFDALISSLELQVKSYIDIDDKENKVETALLIDDKAALDISIANIDEYIYLELPSVTKDFYFYELDEVVQATIEDDIKLVEYIQDIDFKALYKGKYKKIINEYLNDNTEEKDGKVILIVNLPSIIELTTSLLEEAEDDKGLAKDIYEIIVDLGKEMEDDKFKPKSEEIRELVEGIKNFKENVSEKEFVDEFNTLVVDINEDLSQESGIFSDDMEVKISFEFGLLNNIKTLSYESELYGANVNLDIDFTEGASKPKYSKNKGIDMATITDEETSEMVVKAFKNITENSKVQDAITASGILSIFGYDDINLFIEDMTNNISQQYLD